MSNFRILQNNINGEHFGPFWTYWPYSGLIRAPGAPGEVANLRSAPKPGLRHIKLQDFTKQDQWRIFWTILDILAIFRVDSDTRCPRGCGQFTIGSETWLAAYQTSGFYKTRSMEDILDHSGYTGHIPD